MLLYGSVATGYKQGGFGDGCSTGATTQVTSRGESCALTLPQAIYYQLETLIAYELGFRGPVMPGVRIDTEIFYYDYNNMQLSSLLNINGAPTLVTTNAGKSRVMGLEFEAIINPAPNHQFNFGVNLTSAEYVHFCPTGTRLIGRYSLTQFGTAPVQCFTPSHTNTQASATYNAPDKKWYLQAYVMNTENFIEVRAATADTVTPGDPRTYGVRAGFKF